MHLHVIICKSVEGKNMKKLIIVLLLTASLLFANSIVGSWQVDRKRTQSANKGTNQKILASSMVAMARMDIYGNKTLIAPNIGLKGKWIKKGKHYFLVADGEKKPIVLLDANHMTMTLGSRIYYTRIGNTAPKKTVVKQSEVGFKLESVYRSKKIKGDYRFLLLSKHKTVYFLQTDKTSHVSKKEIMSGKLFSQSKHGFVFHNDSPYEMKRGQPYIPMEDKEISVLSSKKLKYDGAEYVLQK